MLTKEGTPVDASFTDMYAEELSEGNSFFIYQSENADSLASCFSLVMKSAIIRLVIH